MDRKLLCVLAVDDPLEPEKYLSISYVPLNEGLSFEILFMKSILSFPLLF